MLNYLLVFCLFPFIITTKTELKDSTVEIVVKTAGESITK